MKYIILPFLIFISLSFAYSQQLVWSDNFESTAANWDLNVTPVGGVNASEANLWKISDEEGGVTPPGCGVAGNGNKTLHITCQGALCIGTGAVYNAGDAGWGLGPANTDKRAKMNTGISTSGYTDLSVTFDWIGVGQSGQDYAVMEYSTDGGNTWNEIWTQVQGEVCGSGQGKWKEETVNLPVATENISDLRFAFRWRNDNDGAGTDPSFAVNDIRLYSGDDGNPPDPTGPTANFTTPSTTICIGDCINFTDASTGTNISSWSWTFNGADTPTSTDKNPSNICYSTAGTYNVTLTVTDDNGTDSKTIQIVVNDCSNPNLPTADFTTSSFFICPGDCIDFTDASTGPDINSWNWTFQGGVPANSTSQNPSNICFNNIGTFDVMLTVANDDGSNTVIKQITVQDCASAPTAMFSVDTAKICKNDCVSFTDESIGNPTSWYWEFEGANVEFSTAQHPSNICYDSAGVFTVSLTVENEHGMSQVINTVQVLELPRIEGYSDTIIEMGGTATLYAVPIDPGEVFWEPITGLNCNVCLEVNASPIITTTYFPSIIGTNGCIGRDTIIVMVDFYDVVDVASAFSPNGDGFNDVLHVLGVGIASIDFKIFNRFGQLVFSTTNMNKGWDGTDKGQPLNSGVFFYTLDYKLVDGSEQRKSGNVTLIK